nr:MAG TPA: hypothetical protein [Caudoviricetes sp.]
MRAFFNASPKFIKHLLKKVYQILPTMSRPKNICE